MSNRIQSLSISSEGPRQTPNQSFGSTLASTLAQGTAGAIGLASPLLGAVNPMLSAPVSQAAAAIGQLASQSRAQVRAGSLNADANFATGPTGASTGSAPQSSDPMAAIGGGADSDPMSMLRAQAEMNNQYLMLQNQMQQESREYEAMSNIMKVRHDTAKNAISNIH